VEYQRRGKPLRLIEDFQINEETVSMLNEVSAKRLDEKSPLGLYLATLGAAA
jgi:hypothetical protein